jgi:hypothetical protein
MSKKLPTPEHKTNQIVHARGEVERLTKANRDQGEQIFNLTAGLREVHAILRTKDGSLPHVRIDQASAHIVRVLANYGGFIVPSKTPRRG